MKINLTTSHFKVILLVGTIIICTFHHLCFAGVFSFWHKTDGSNVIEHYRNAVSTKIAIDNQQDVGIYYKYAQATLSGELPYSDFVPEYPPLALPFMIVPALFTSDAVGYGMLFSVEMTIFACATAILVLNYINKHKPSLVPKYTLLFLLSLFLFGNIAVSRLDAVSAFLLVLTTLFVLKNKPFGSAIFGATGFAAKLFPILALIPHGIYLLWRKDWRRITVLAASFLFFSLAYWAAPLVQSPHGVLSSFLYHGQRGLQIESVLGLPVWIIHLFTGNTPVVYNFGALHFDTALADFIAKLSLPLFVLYTAGISAIAFFRLSGHSRHSRKNSLKANTNISSTRARQKQFVIKTDFQTRKMLFFYVFLLVLGFVVFNKVFSPQYMLWVVWLALLGLPYLPKKGFWPLLLAIQLATFVIFPILYGDLISGKTFAVGLAIARNLATPALLLWTTHLFAKPIPLKFPLST